MWYENLEGNKFIENLYTKVPVLINVRIIAIKVTDEGRRITINFNMPRFADNPPTKWMDSGYNTVFVELDFFDVLESTISFTRESLRGNIIIEKSDEGKLKVVISGTVNMNLVAEVGMIQSVSGYIDEFETT
ncbi:Imm50 family immunity protein [Brevibacillus laterosporus]|uniref:Imm50 family immunity protein n=1 Tax=Brevibacillus laterosporus TaxID=1465 RepID=UPI002E1CBCA6|nr:Imm50 family immunity protein [Brevibacillus laterosporus]